MTASSPLVFFGSDDFSAGVLRELLKDVFFKTHLKYVVTKTSRKKIRGRTISHTAVAELAATIPNVEILYANTRAELDAVIEPLPAPLSGVLVSYGVIVSTFVLNKFEPGIINLHPSLLPKYRGPSPVEAAILNGDSELGLSVMKLESEMDAGPIYTQQVLALRGDETPALLYERIARDHGQWFAGLISAIVRGETTPQPQDASRATYCKMIKKEDGQLRPESKTADELEREVRAYQDFPKSYIIWKDQRIVVTRAHTVDSADTAPLTLSCLSDTYLAIDELIAPSGKKMPAEAFLRGIRQ